MIAALVLFVAQAVAAVAPTPDARERALAELMGPNGPVRFSQVGDHLFRGGQPTPHQIELLHEIGVDNIVDLRQMHGSLRREEERTAKKLGMEFHSFPFNATFGANTDFLKSVVGAIATDKHTTYVHCHVGRDRTSLVIAMWRVLVDHWDPDKAWAHDAVAFGYEDSFWYRAIRNSFAMATSGTVGTR